MPRNPLDDLQEYFTSRPVPHALSCLGDAGGEQLSGRELSGLLERDPESARRVGQLLGNETVASPRELLERCGPSELQRMLWVAAIGGAMAPPEQAPYRDFWLHALRTRAIVRLLIDSCCPAVDPAPLILPALLHDAGQLVYHACYPQDAARIVAYCREHGTLWQTAERYYQLPSHGELGAALVEFLALPEAVATACLNHEATELRLLAQGELLAPDELVLIALANGVDRLSDPHLAPESIATLRHAVDAAMAPEDERIDQLGLELVEVLSAADRQLERFALAA